MIALSAAFLWLAIFFYTISFLCVMFLNFKRHAISAASVITMSAGILAQISSILLRGFALGRMPLANVYEFIVLMSLFLAIFFIAVLKKNSSPVVTVLLQLAVIALNITASLLKPSVSPLAPSLQSPWLQFHVLSAILAYGSFGAAFCMAVVYLAAEHKKSSKITAHHSVDLAGLDRKMYRIILIGYLFMSVVLLSGALWAEQVWGSWWSWDPKETFALVTWLIYTLYLHLRATMGYSGKKSAVVAVAGFVVVLFTLFGITWLMPGLHSYR